MRKCENLLLYGRKRGFSTIGSMKNITIRMKIRNYENG